MFENHLDSLYKRWYVIVVALERAVAERSDTETAARNVGYSLVYSKQLSVDSSEEAVASSMYHPFSSIELRRIRPRKRSVLSEVSKALFSGHGRRQPVLLSK